VTFRRLFHVSPVIREGIPALAPQLTRRIREKTPIPAVYPLIEIWAHGAYIFYICSFTARWRAFRRIAPCRRARLRAPSAASVAAGA
jgi:hypothetical protein